MVLCKHDYGINQIDDHFVFQLSEYTFFSKIPVPGMVQCTVLRKIESFISCCTLRVRYSTIQYPWY